MPPRQPASTPSTEHPWDPYGPNIPVTIGQGPAARLYVVSVSMMSHYSGYFQVMTGWPNVELTIDDHIRLPGESPDVWEMVLHYCEYRRFTTGNDIDLHFDQITDLYALGANRVMPLVQNATADLFAARVKAYGCLPDRWSVEYLWEKCRSGAALRVLLIELVRAMWIGVPERRMSLVWNELAGGENETPEGLIDMIEGLEASHLSIRVSYQTLTRLQSCTWHVHDDGERCAGSDEFMLGAGERADQYAADRPELQRGGRGPYQGIGPPH